MLGSRNCNSTSETKCVNGAVAMVSALSEQSSARWTTTAIESSISRSSPRLWLLSGKYKYLCNRCPLSLFPKKVDVQGLMSFYDVNGDGNICYEEFISGLRDPLTDRKKNMVDKAFGIMDKDGSKQIGVNDIAYRYDVSKNADFKSGAATKEQILQGFLDQFDGLRGNNDGKVAYAEWVDYYTDLAVSTPSDDYFVVMMEQTWGVAEDDGSQNFKDKVRELIKLLRQRLITISNGH